jgi:hypothetical protein
VSLPSLGSIESKETPGAQKYGYQPWKVSLGVSLYESKHKAWMIGKCVVWIIHIPC